MSGGARHTLRRDPMTGDWVVLAPSRRGIPMAPSLRHFEQPADDPAACPFCPGHESETEHATQEMLGGDGRWQARSVLNRYPIIEYGDEVAGLAQSDERAAVGAHEVLVESPAHARDLADFTRAEALVALTLYRDRARALRGHPGARYVALFRNKGARAGSSQPHPHAQCVALPLVPPRVSSREARARAFYRRKGVPLLRSLLDEALREGGRVIERTGAFCAVTPWVPHRRYECWVAPYGGASEGVAFGDTPIDELAELACLLVRTVRRVRAATSGAAYNLVLRQPARANERAPWARWHFEVLPRTGGDAGFELNAEVNVVTVDPVEAAITLREKGVE